MLIILIIFYSSFLIRSIKLLWRTFQNKAKKNDDVSLHLHPLVISSSRERETIYQTHTTPIIFYYKLSRKRKRSKANSIEKKLLCIKLLNKITQIVDIFLMIIKESERSHFFLTRRIRRRWRVSEWRKITRICDLWKCHKRL